jgi:hypothetical protein
MITKYDEPYWNASTTCRQFACESDCEMVTSRGTSGRSETSFLIATRRSESDRTPPYTTDSFPLPISSVTV